jgi:glyoxylase-like metal-dependent hydrolase (beta-lactamase superfamily II)
MPNMPISSVIALTLLACGACTPSADDTVAVANNVQVQDRGANKDNWWDKLPRPEWSAYEQIETDQDWFEVYAIDDEIYAIYEPGQFEEVMSFLIVGEDRALLFDTGLGIGDIRSVVTALTDRDIVVLNSHTHYDHIGGNYQFETIYGRDTPYTRGRMAGSPNEAVAGFLREGWVWKPLPPGFDPESYASRPFEIDRIVDEGDVIDIGGRRLEILNTPGHAPDSICLIDRENRLLFTGDTFYLAPLYTHLEGSSFDDYAESASRLAALAGDIDAALTSHNVPVVDASYMTALGAAFAGIRDGSAEDVTISDGFREYHFDGFSVIVRDDGQAAGE